MNSMNPKQLALTSRGEAWLSQFDSKDLDQANQLLRALTLVSHTEFERQLTTLLIQQGETLPGPVALYATREVDPAVPYFDRSGHSSVAFDGSDLGSEARIANLIRNLSRGNPKKYLNNPTIGEMRRSHCRSVFVVDDFIGSGERTAEFIASLWLSSTLRSWNSLHLIGIRAVAYSATEKGRKRVEKERSKPEVIIVRDCPTFAEMPWPKAVREDVMRIVDRYGRKTSLPGFARGYEETAAAIVFEHGCPDNCPAILWAPENADWRPLFPQRSVLAADASAFPPEIVRRDPTLTMIEAGQARLAGSGSLSKKGPIATELLLVLGLVAKGLRRRAPLAHATGLTSADCSRLLRVSIQWGLITPTLRLTPAGAAELAYAKRSSDSPNTVPSRGSDSYYPWRLRRPVHG